MGVMDMVVEINKSPNADPRTADKGKISFEEFSKDYYLVFE